MLREHLRDTTWAMDVESTELKAISSSVNMTGCAFFFFFFLPVRPGVVGSRLFSKQLSIHGEVSRAFAAGAIKWLEALPSIQ